MRKLCTFQVLNDKEQEQSDSQSFANNEDLWAGGGYKHLDKENIKAETK